MKGGLENPGKGTKTMGKDFCKTSFQLRMGLKKHRNKAKITMRKKTTLYMYICCVFADVG